MLFQFKIQIKGITKPPVWRKVAVPADFTFLKFHDVIQTVFGWEDDHLFEFSDKEYQSNIRISLPIEDDFFVPGMFAEAEDASETKLSDFFADDTRKLLYTYDFGDSWIHEIALEAITDDTQKRAVCLSGKGACPPEDCGGIYGYEHIKKIFATMPNGEQAEQYREWLGLDEDEVWDINAFDIDEVNLCLKQI